MNADSTPETVSPRIPRNRPGRQQSSPQGWSAVKSSLRFLADIFGLLSFVAFVVSIALSSIVFARWGLNFLQLASPSDVLMSGLYLVSVFVWPLLVGIFIMIYPTAILLNVLDFFRKDSKSIWSRALAWVNKFVGLKSVMATGYVLMWTTSVIIIAVITDQINYGPFTILKLYVESMSITAIASIVVAFALAGILFWDQGDLGRELPTAVSASMSVIFLLLFGHLFIHSQVRDGFQHSPIYVHDTTDCNNRCRILWIGSQASVLETLDANLQRTGIIVSRGDVFLRVEPTRR